MCDLHDRSGRMETNPRPPSWLSQYRLWLSQYRIPVLPQLFANDGPLDLRILGRAVLQAAVVGVACGLLGALFLMPARSDPVLAAWRC